MQRASIGLTLLAALVMTVPAAGQEPPARPFRGLFGGDAPRGAGQALDVTMSVAQGYDENLFGGTGADVDPRVRAGGLFSSAAAVMTYSAGGPRFSLEARGSADGRYSSDYRAYASTTYEGAVAVRAQGSRLAFRAEQGAADLPYYTFRFFPRLEEPGLDTVTPAGVDYALVARRTVDLRSDAELSYRLGRASALSAAYTRTALAQAALDVTQLTQDASLSMSHPLSARASLRLGYGRQWSVARMAGVRSRADAHRFDAGIDYNRALSISRRTSIAFGSGATSFSTGQQEVYAVTGHASLTHEIGRTWTGRLGFSRGVQILEGLREPFLADAVSADLGGYISRQVDFAIGAGYARGTDAAAVRTRYETLTGTARVQMAFSRYAAVYVQYFGFHYAFRGAAGLIGALPPAMDRYGARAGLTLWLPLLR